MALPKINDVPEYTTVVPSTGKKVTYRPFLVREQKVLMVALESGDEDQIIRAIVNTVGACYKDVNVNKLATFDIEYLFTQLRAKSVGEHSKLSYKCSECETPNDIEVDLTTIEIKVDKSNTSIKLNELYTLKLRYPGHLLLSDISKTVTEEKSTITGTLYNIAAACLDELQTEDELIKFDDEKREDINEFLENLNTAQFDKVMEFVMNLPKLTKEVEFDCINCSHHNSFTLQGIGDFF